MTRIVVELPSALPHQLDIIRSPAREKVVACGRRFGKTTLGIRCCLVGHGEGSSRRIGAIEGGKIWWVAPIYREAEDVWREVKNRLHPLLQAGLVDKSEQHMRISFQTGGVFEIKSAERPDYLRGAGLDGVVQDEAAFQDEELYYSVLRPSLADRKGWWIGISTPCGFNWFKEKFDNSKDRWRRDSFQAPWMDEDERERILHDYGGYGEDYRRIAEMDPRYRQEYLADFVAEGAGAFDPSWWREWTEWPSKTPRRSLQCWDTAFGKGEGGDYSVCVTASEFDDGIYVRDVWRGKPAFPDLKREAQRLQETFSPDLVLIEDKASGQSLIQELQRETTIRLYPVRADKDKQSRVSAAQPLVQSGRVFLPKFASWKHEFVRELAKFPCGQYDDQVDAFAHLVNYVRFLPPLQESRKPRHVLAGGPCWPNEEEGEEANDLLGDIFAREEVAW